MKKCFVWIMTALLVAALSLSLVGCDNFEFDFGFGYTVTWKNDDGSVLEVDRRLEKGEVPTYNGKTPTKEEDEDYVYTFNGWTPAIVEVAKNAVYQATYKATPKEKLPTYTITFADYDDTLLFTATVTQGQLPVYGADDPSRQEDDRYIYVFDGWTPVIAKATADCTYTATYRSIAKDDDTPYYTVSWLNYDGTPLETDAYVEEGALPTYDGATPTRPSDEDHSYAFDSWSPVIGEVKADISYTATYRTVDRNLSMTVYAVNDFHGAIEQTGSEAGLGYFATYFKQKGQRPDTLLIDSGDTWQGSIYSNYNHGRIVVDVYNAIGMDVRTVGNHDFDWGLDALRANTAATLGTATLGANIYNYNFNTKQVGYAQQSDLAKETATFTLENGLKVGVVGVIGDDQITTIDSMYVQDIAFIDHISVIKKQAKALRDEGCDIVICSIHGGQEDVLGNSLSEYVDLVLCAHTHQLENTTEDGVLFAQFGSLGKYFGEITLTLDTLTGKVSTSFKTLYASDVVSEVRTVDSEVQSIIDEYNASCDAEADQVVVKQANGNFSSSGALPNLMSRALYDECVKQGYDDVYLTYVNNARSTLRSGQWTYADLYQAFPFDNEVYIIEVTGQEILNEVAKYNFIYKPDTTDWTVYTNRKYKIAAIDYLVFHTNKSRRYDYFPTNAGRYVGKLEGNYRTILRDWLIDQGFAEFGVLSAGAFSSSGEHFARTNLSNGGTLEVVSDDYDFAVCLPPEKRLFA